MTGREAELLVETVRFRAALVRRELDQAAAVRATFRNGPLEHAPPQSGLLSVADNTHRLDLSAPGSVARQPWDESELECSYDPATLRHHNEELIRIRLDRREC